MELLYIVNNCHATYAFPLEVVFPIRVILVRSTYNENRNNSIDIAKYQSCVCSVCFVVLLVVVFR